MEHVIRKQLEWIAHDGLAWLTEEYQRGGKTSWLRTLKGALSAGQRDHRKYASFIDNPRNVGAYFEARAHGAPQFYIPIRPPERGLGQRLFLLSPHVLGDTDELYSWEFVCNLYLRIFQMEDEEAVKIASYGHRFEAAESEQDRHPYAHVQMLNPNEYSWLCEKALSIPVRAENACELFACFVLSLYGPNLLKKMMDDVPSFSGPPKRTITKYVDQVISDS